MCVWTLFPQKECRREYIDETQRKHLNAIPCLNYEAHSRDTNQKFCVMKYCCEKKSAAKKWGIID